MAGVRGRGVMFGFGLFTRSTGTARATDVAPRDGFPVEVVTDPPPVLVRGRGGTPPLDGADPGLRSVAMT